MAYSTSNPPACISQPLAGAAGQAWTYLSTHTAAATAASSFISNGAALGMQVGDSFRCVELTTAGVYTAHADGCVSAVTTAAGATITFAQATT